MSDTQLPAVPRTEPISYMSGDRLVISDAENERAWISGKPTRVRR